MVANPSPDTDRAASPKENRAASPKENRAASPKENRAASPKENRAASPKENRDAAPDVPAIAPPADANPAPVAFAARKLCLFFGEGALRKQVLFDIDLAVRSGEIVLLTGPSGSGKTTLLTLVGGLRSVQQGSLTVLGRELNGASPADLVAVRRQSGYIFQAHNLHRSLTALQNARMGLELHREFSAEAATQRAAAMLERVGLGDRLDYYPHNLSGGQKQRVAIARALAPHPQIVLADEPTAALDGKSGREVVDLMRDLARQQGCTILMVTHDNRILDVADRVLHLEDGRLSYDDPTPTSTSPETAIS